MPLGRKLDSQKRTGVWFNPDTAAAVIRRRDSGSGGDGAREPAMLALARTARGLWPPTAGMGCYGQVQPSRGIMVQVRDGNLERALQFMERKMRSSGIERLIKRRTEHSEKRVLAHNN